METTKQQIGDLLNAYAIHHAAQHSRENNQQMIDIIDKIHGMINTAPPPQPQPFTESFVKELIENEAFHTHIQNTVQNTLDETIDNLRDIVIPDAVHDTLNRASISVDL